MISANSYGMRAIFVLCLLVISPLSWGHGSVESYGNPLCEKLLAETALTEKQILTVLQAHSKADDLVFRVLSKTIGQRKFSIVLLGEHHFATDLDLSLGLQVTREFRRFATENGSSNTSGRVYRHKMMPVAALAELPARLLGMRKGQRKNMSPMDMPRQLGHEVDNAEEGHIPSIGEELNLLGFAAFQASAFACMGVCAYSLANAALTGELAPNLMAFALASGYLLFSARVIHPLVRRNMHRLPIVQNRDRTIARNLNTMISVIASLEPPEFDHYRWELNPSYLVILGRAHLANTARFLVDEYDFTETTLPESRSP